MKRKLFLLTLLLAASGCRQPPRQEWSELQQLKRELLQVRADRFLPDLYKPFELQYARLQGEYARVSARHPLFRITADLEKELASARLDARTLLEQTLAFQSELRIHQERRLKLVEEELKKVGAFRLNPHIRNRLARIEIMRHEAQALWKQKDYLKVSRRLNDISELFGEIDETIQSVQERYFNPDLANRWKQWHHQTIDWSRNTGLHALVVDKYNRRAFLYHRGLLMEEYRVELGRNPFPAKIRLGDGATPEGRYRVVKKKGLGQTRYFRALLLDYPNAADRISFQTLKSRGEIDPDAQIGSLIEIHGEGGRGQDWTEGCVALDNGDMQRLFDLAYAGMPVTVVGRLNL